MPKDETDLLRNSARGDASSFGELVGKYRYLVYAVALQIVKDPAAAQDVAQDTFISAFVSLKELRSMESFPSWLRKIARNKAVAWGKEQDRLAPLEDAGNQEYRLPRDFATRCICGCRLARRAKAKETGNRVERR